MDFPLLPLSVFFNVTNGYSEAKQIQTLIDLEHSFTGLSCDWEDVRRYFSSKGIDVDKPSSNDWRVPGLGLLKK